MNYFNYFTEIEDEFVRRRGSHLMVSPLDWSLMEVWKERGIPLHIILRAINNSFDGYDKRPNRGRKVNSLLYCRQEVESCYHDYLESRVGASVKGSEPGDEASRQPNDPAGKGQDSGNEPFKPAAILEYLAEQSASLRQLAIEAPKGGPLQEVLARVTDRLAEVIDDLSGVAAISCEALESDLTLIEGTILEGLRANTDPAILAALEKEGKQQLKAYRETMKPEVYQQTIDNFVSRRLREMYLIPRLSLFYLNP